jgi:hypothetical protein
MNLTDTAIFKVKYPSKGFELYEAILGQLFFEFTVKLNDTIISSDERRDIILKFQTVFESCKTRYGKNVNKSTQDSIEQLSILASATALEVQIKNLLESLNIQKIIIDWDEDHLFIEKIVASEETRITKKIFNIQ